MRGVGAIDYNEGVLPKLVTDGDKAFAGNRILAKPWIFTIVLLPTQLG